MRALLLPIIVSTLLGCADDTRTRFVSDGGAADAAVDAGPTLADGAIRPIPQRDSGFAPGCSEAAQLVYVLSDQNDLYSFRPNRREFTRIGRMTCGGGEMRPNSMAIDRNAVAWVNYVRSDFGDTAGAIFRVDTSDASCLPGAGIGLPAGWYRLGMGFSTAGVDDPQEALFVTGTGSGTQGLGRVDPPTLSPIGQFTGALRGRDAELTGTGDGRLYGFFTTTPVQVAQIDKSSGTIISTQALAGVETPAAWAFSFWGGDFFLYTAPAAGRTSNVTRYRPSDGSVDPRYMVDIGFRIVGAGVSTCAPIAPPP